VAAVVTVMNMKGGVGKTTVATHLAGLAARYDLGKGRPLKVLAIDYDPQFNMSQAYLRAKRYFDLESRKRTVLSVLVDDDGDLDPYKLQVPGNLSPPKLSQVIEPIYAGPVGRLDLVPSTLDLMYVALGKVTSPLKPMEERFRKFIEEARSTYDLIVIDCHPAGSVFTQTALTNSDHVVIPVVPRKYGVRGIGLMMKFIAATKVGNHGATAHILFNAVPRSGVLAEESRIRADRSLSAYCLTNTLKWYKAFEDPEGGTGFVWSSTKPWSDRAFSNLNAVSRELMKRIEL
jgi:chromosome partitioning protein